MRESISLCLCSPLDAVEKRHTQAEVPCSVAEQGLEAALPLGLDSLSMQWGTPCICAWEGLQSLWSDGRNIAHKLIRGAMFTVYCIANSKGSKIRSAFPLTQWTGSEIKIVSNTLWIFSSSVEILRVCVFTLFLLFELEVDFKRKKKL